MKYCKRHILSVTFRHSKPKVYGHNPLIIKSTDTHSPILQYVHCISFHKNSEIDQLASLQVSYIILIQM